MHEIVPHQHSNETRAFYSRSVARRKVGRIQTRDRPLSFGLVFRAASSLSRCLGHKPVALARGPHDIMLGHVIMSRPRPSGPRGGLTSRSGSTFGNTRTIAPGICRSKLASRAAGLARVSCARGLGGATLTTADERFALPPGNHQR
jgi:hypothetical protein